MSPPLRPSDDLRELSPHEAAMQLEAGATLLYDAELLPEASAAPLDVADARATEPLLLPPNFRDLASTVPSMRPGAVFRSSELLTAQTVREHGIRSIVDLRQEPRACARASERRRGCRHRLLSISSGIWFLSGFSAWYYAVKDPGSQFSCPYCPVSRGLPDGTKIFHIDLLPKPLMLGLFYSLPFQVKVQAIRAELRREGGGAEAVVGRYIADSRFHGYELFYKRLVTDAGGAIARALLVFTDPGNFPIIVHCIHGKDRTGLVVALLLTLLGGEEEAIVRDYTVSQANLERSLHSKTLVLQKTFLTETDVMSAPSAAMEATLSFIRERYGSVRGYVRKIGLKDADLEAIQRNLMR